MATLDTLKLHYQIKREALQETGQKELDKQYQDILSQVNKKLSEFTNPKEEEKKN